MRILHTMGGDCAAAAHILASHLAFRQAVNGGVTTCQWAEQKPATTLSGGEQQMLAMARIMVAEPRAVLIDEPSEGLAPMIVAEIFAILREMKDAGCAIVLVEQNIHEALSICDRFVLIERGAIVFEGNAGDKAAEEELLQRLSV